jgi:hypothetical protein
MTPCIVAPCVSSNPNINWRQGPTCRWRKSLEDLETDTGQRRPLARPKWAQAGRPRPAGPAHFQAQLGPPLT